MGDYTKTFYIEKDPKTGKETTRLNFTYLIALIILAACGFLIALQMNGIFNSINNSLVVFFKKNIKNFMLWSWTLTLLIGIVVIGLSIGFIWLTFEIFIKDNEQARQQMFD
jgi:hypothetical protein